MDKLWNIGLRWDYYESPRLEVTLFHYFKGDAFYILHIQLYKIIFSIYFDIYEYHEKRKSSSQTSGK